MKLLKKILPLAVTGLLLGMTVGFAVAADLGTWKASFPGADTVMVIGADAPLGIDTIGAINIATALGVTTGGGETTIVGESKSLASGTDLVYLNDDLAENVATLTKDDLATVLADGTFTDDDGTNYDYEQTLTIGTSTSNNFAFSESANDLDDPVLMIEVTDDTSTPIYTWNLNFDEATPLNATASEGEEIVLFGKTYTVSTSTDADTLVLLGGADSETIDVGETVTMTVNEVDYEVTLNGISSDTAPKASISVDGESKTFTEGQSKDIGGIDVYVKTVFRTGDNMGYVEVQLGADKLTFETTDAVKIGTDEDNIDGTLVTITGGVNAITKMTIAVSAADNDEDYILEGDSFVDPVFGTLSVDFVSVKNGPVFSAEDDVSTERTALRVNAAGDRELTVTITDSSGVEKTVPFTYEDTLQDDAGYDIKVVEGATLEDNEYFILNSGNYQHFMRMTKVDTDQTEGDVHFKDQFTGTEYKIDNSADLDADGDSDTITINNQVYTIYVVSASENQVSIRTSDYDTNLAVFPYLELVSAKDHRVALTDVVAINEEVTGATNVVNSTKIYELPSGTIQFGIDNGTNYLDKFVYKIDSASSWTETSTADDTYTIGAVDYYIDTTFTTTNKSLVIVDIALENSQNANGDTEQAHPALLFIEEEDKTESTADTKNAVVLMTTNDTSHSEADTPVFTGTYDTETWDDTDFVGYLTNFGTYVLLDKSDSDQHVVRLTYPKEQMYANVYVSEVGAVITTTTTTTAGVVTPILDTEIDDYKTMNIISVGGSAINRVTADLLGLTYPTYGSDEAWVTATGVDAMGKAVIKIIDSPYATGKYAMIVAGWEGADTRRAAKALVEGTPAMSGTSVLLDTATDVVTVTIAA